MTPFVRRHTTHPGSRIAVSGLPGFIDNRSRGDFPMTPLLRLFHIGFEMLLFITSLALARLRLSRKGLKPPQQLCAGTARWVGAPFARIVRAPRISGSQRDNLANTRWSILLRVGFFGDLRSRIFSWWRSARISISSEARDRNNPISPHQISLQRLHIVQKHRPIRSSSPAVLGLR